MWKRNHTSAKQRIWPAVKKSFVFLSSLFFVLYHFWKIPEGKPIDDLLYRTTEFRRWRQRTIEYEVSQQPVPPHDSISQLQLSISHAAVDVPRAARSLYVRAFDSLTETKLKHSDWINCVFPRAQFLPSTSSSPFQTHFASFSLHFLSSFHFSLWVFLFQFLFFLFVFH